MKQYEIDPNKLSKIFQTILDLIDSIDDEKSKLGIKQMFADLGERFFSAPASHRAEYHNCFPGGLAAHSLGVYKNLLDFCRDRAPDVPSDSIIKVAILHDIGKVGTVTEDYYVVQDSQWHRDKLGEFYKINADIEYMPHNHRSLHLCQHYGIPLSELEFKAIMIHDGQYIDANSSYKNKEGLFAILVHMADMLACTSEKEQYRKFVS